MAKNTSNPNIEWKKPGFDDAERETRKTDTQKAAEYGAQKSRVVNTANKNSPLPLSLNKIRKKIRDVIDEDEDEDENDYQIAASAHFSQNSLENALNEDEKILLRNKEERETVRMGKDIDNINAMLVLNRFVKESGLKKLDKETLNKNIDNPTATPTSVTKEAVRTDIARKAKVKWEDFDDKDLISFLRGVKRIRDVGGDKAIEKMRVNEIVEAGHDENDEKKIAKLILKKSGRSRKAKKKIEQINIVNIKPKDKTVLDKVYGRG